MTDGKPPSVRPEDYWTTSPPERSTRCQWWVDRINKGWQPNGRIRSMGYYEAAIFYGVYIWEYLEVISPLLNRRR